MKPPSYNSRIWRRAIFKGLALFVCANVLFALLNPIDALLPLSVFGRVVPYRTRLVPAEDNISVQLASLETLIHAHEIAQPKKSDEFRVVILGDSGIYGWGNDDSQTISASLSGLHISIGDKKLRAYNLAAPFLSATRDLLIAESVSAYQPDLVLWFVTLQGFRNNDRNPLVELNQQAMTRLTARFGLDDENAQKFGHYSPTLWDRSLIGQRQVIYRWLKYQSYMFRPDEPNATNHLAVDDTLPENPPAPETAPTYMPMPNAAWSPLQYMQAVVNTPVLIINEPILIMPDNTLNYDSYYGVALYDKYRMTLNTFCVEHQLWYLDLWNLLSASAYTDTPLHHTAAGNEQIAVQVAAVLQTHFQ